MQTFGHRFKAAAAIEFIHGGDDGVTLGFRAGVLHGFLKQFVWNINRRFHASKIA